jgi:hypothetical protein
MKRPRLLPFLLASTLALCGLAGGGAWLAWRCDRDDYLNRVAPSWLNEREQYLFACGAVWHSFDNGQTWTTIRAQGLPWLLRDGYIAADREPGRMYLGIVLSSQSSLSCPLCALTRAEPALYLSNDGGLHWTLSERFASGPAGESYFHAVYADPNYAGSAWAVLTRGDETAYFATNNNGDVWRKTCVETYTGQCDPPDEFLANKTLLDRINEDSGPPAPPEP